ncbi:GntR family transcriptional regulator [Agrobacterium vitis]|uniref:FadR/GntR family transcriptional regulator n=1 Tax=Agrobacterium vitis TaxID=373 RepID=UPI0015D88C6C|nr:FadR/GntR family transcriptional regulator [Agrobacterium vitis]BCH61242.1 GntR family transcriptional regulator [Agrobacterium vitis]
MIDDHDNSNLALNKLRELLSSGRFSAGEKLPTERSLCEELCLGRRSVRGALEVLEAEGLIWRRQGSGTFAGARPDAFDDYVGALVAGTDPLEVMEVRLRLEPQLAQLAAMRANAVDVQAMYDLVAKIGASKDADGRELWDGALHRKIAQCAGNSLFLALFDVMNRTRQDPAWQNIREQARAFAQTRPVTHGQHLAIIDRIASRDPIGAGEAMRTHLLTLQESLIRITSIDTAVHVAEA